LASDIMLLIISIVRTTAAPWQLSYLNVADVLCACPAAT
jgi:hypothetical protein